MSSRIPSFFTLNINFNPPTSTPPAPASAPLTAPFQYVHPSYLYNYLHLDGRHPPSHSILGHPNHLQVPNSTQLSTIASSHFSSSGTLEPVITLPEHPRRTQTLPQFPSTSPLPSSFCPMDHCILLPELPAYDQPQPVSSSIPMEVVPVPVSEHFFELPATLPPERYELSLNSVSPAAPIQCLECRFASLISNEDLRQQDGRTRQGENNIIASEPGNNSSASAQEQTPTSGAGTHVVSLKSGASSDPGLPRHHSWSLRRALSRIFGGDNRRSKQAREAVVQAHGHRKERKRRF